MADINQTGVTGTNRRYELVLETMRTVARHRDGMNEAELLAEIESAGILSADDRRATGASGTPRFRIDIGWGTSDAVKAGWLTKSGSGWWKVTSRGNDALKAYPEPAAFREELRRLIGARALAEASAADPSNVRWWIEKTIVGRRKDRQEGEHAVGRALWSPTKSKGGTDIYRFMREIQPGDRVLHLTDNAAFTGISIAAGKTETFEGLANTPWTGECYLVRLRDYRPLDPVLTREVFFSPPFGQRLTSLIDQGEKNLFFHAKPNPALNQGAYLTPAPPSLIDILDDAYRATTGKGLMDGVAVVPRFREPVGPTTTFDELVALTLWTPDALRELIDALWGDSYQVVLAGPPGTGKTWVARSVVNHLAAGRPALSRMVQFHPSYSYEQFIEGLRPVVDAKSNAISFTPVRGVVLDFARQITPGGPDHFLIVDEMNRANLPRVLGELMFLFEYRKERIDLPYTKDFALPKELRFIGTMNTADRSIRSIDIALRRRFDVFDCPADPGILSRYYETRANEIPDLIAGFEQLNARLTLDLDQHHTIGQSFFMANPMTPEVLRKAWRRKLLPLIREYFFDQPDRVGGYELQLLWPSLG